MPSSLHAFAKQYGLSKSTVYRRCQALELDTSQGLSDDAIDLLKLDFDLMEDEVVVVDTEVVDAGVMAIEVAGNQSLPAIPQFETTGMLDHRSIAQARGVQGQHNLATYVAHTTAQYLHAKTIQHLAGIDAAFANAQQSMAGLADQAIRQGEEK